MTDVAGDLRVNARVVIPAGELLWRFSRSSGPGGQSVNTTDSRVALSWDIRASAAVGDAQRRLCMDRLGDRAVDGVVTVVAAESRSQWQNRRAARLRLAEIVEQALRPPAKKRRKTRPSRGAVDRRLSAKHRRANVKKSRRGPGIDD